MDNEFFRRLILGLIFQDNKRSFEKLRKSPKEIKENYGSMFDSKIVEAFVKVIKNQDVQYMGRFTSKQLKLTWNLGEKYI